MAQVAQIIMTGKLVPSDACRTINMTEPVTMVAEPGEPGWQFWNFSFQIVCDHIYVVVNYSHDDNLDRGLAVRKMRSSMRNLVNWLLLSQAIMTAATIELETDEVMVRYEGDHAWVAHIPPQNERADTITSGTNDAIRTGVGWLRFVSNDRHLLYALQDYATSLKYSEFCLFLLWRAVEWVLWQFETREDARNPAYGPAAAALGLTEEWIGEIGR